MLFAFFKFCCHYDEGRQKIIPTAFKVSNWLKTVIWLYSTGSEKLLCFTVSQNVWLDKGI